MKWTPEERDRLRWAWEVGLTPSKLLGLFPGRDGISLQNQLRLLRDKKKGICPQCRQPWGGERGVCQSCVDRAKHKVQAWKAAGLCAQCGGDRTGGSATICGSCRDKKKAGVRTYRNKKMLAWDKKAPSGSVGASSVRLLSWPATKNLKVLAGLVGAGDRVVDLFGGAGQLTFAVHRAGGKVVVWNDIHPLLRSFMQRVAEGPDAVYGVLADSKALLKQVDWKGEGLGPLVQRYQEAKAGGEDPLGPALLHAMVRIHRGRLGGELGAVGALSRLTTLGPISRERLEEAADALRGVQLLTQSYERVLADWDQEGVVFLVDPPWPGPGGDATYEYPMKGIAFWMLLTHLQGLKHARWAVVVESSDLVVRAVAAIGQGCRLAWLSTLFGKEILITSAGWDVGDVGVRFDLRTLVPLSQHEVQ